MLPLTEAEDCSVVTMGYDIYELAGSIHTFRPI